MCAINIHLLLFLIECYGNKEDVRALACVRSCVRTCVCDLSSKREHQFKDFGRTRSPGIETHAHSHTIWTRNLFLRFRTRIIVKVARKICILCFWFDFCFYGPSTHFRSFRARSVNLATLFLGKPPMQFTST